MPLPSQPEFAAVDILAADHPDDSPPESPNLHFTKKEAQKYLAFLTFCSTVATSTLVEEKELIAGQGHEWLQGRITFWKGVKSACAWQKSIVNLLAKK